MRRKEKQVKVIDELKAYGCDTQTALERFINSEDLYVKFLGKFLSDPSFSEIKPFIDAGDNDGALKSTHTLKGVAGNLGLTKVYEIAADMVNKYRAGDPSGASARYDELAGAYNDMVRIISERGGCFG